MTADFGGLRMKHLNKIIALISALCLMLGMLSGCKGVEAEFENYHDVVDVNADLENVENGVVAQSEHFDMVWHKSITNADGTELDRAIIEFVSKKDGTVWSTTPREYIDSTDAAMVTGSSPINSTLVITVRQGEQTFTFDAYEQCILTGRFSSVKREDGKGITITYYYDNIGVVVSVDYYLEDDGFKVSVDPNNIKSYIVIDEVEDGKGLHGAVEAGSIRKVISVTPAPFMCGGQNTEAGNKNSYLVMPSGSGTLMYIDERSDGVGREFGNYTTKPDDSYGWVYGEDAAVDKYENPQNETPITMPFYGIKKGESALCAIIEQAAESCKITAKAGDPLESVNMFAEKPVGYSYIAASYNTLGYNRVFNKGNWRLHYNDDVDRNITPLVIGYYPLSGEQANYTGMAKRYQKYLEDKENLKKSEDNTLLNVKLYGSYVKDELFVGIPYEKKVALTTYDEATKILGELKKISGGNLNAVMQGYGEGGINANKLAGGYTLTGVVGNKKSLNNFIKFTNDNGIKTFFSFDPINYYESGNGYSVKNDSAVNVNGIPIPKYSFLLSTRDRFTIKKGGKVGTLISRENLTAAVNDAVELVDKIELPGIAFDSLGTDCYSDYDYADKSKTVYKNPMRNNMGNDVKTIVADVKKNSSKTVLMDGAFAYSAVAADIITNAPTSSLKANAFDVDVPLYQIVFQGYRANSVAAINIAVNKRTQFLKAIETGSGLSFDLVNNYSEELRKQTIMGLQATYYADNVKLIEQYVNEGKSFLASVAGAKIANHSYLSNNVTQTTFDNGVTVYVNYGDTDFTVSEGVVVKAQGFLNK